MSNQLPTHPRTGLQALAVMPSGRVVWPVLGAEDNGGQGGAQGGGQGGGQGGDGDGQNGGAGGQGQGGSGNDGGAGNGDGGTKTFDQAAVDRIVAERLTRERSKYSDYDDLKAKATELDQLKESTASDQEKALNKARKETEETVRGQLEPRLNRLEVALRLGLPDELGAKVLSAAKRLVGSNLQELEDDAREFFATSPITVNGSRGGAGKAGKGLDQGARGKSGQDKPTVATGADLYAQRRGKKT